jgi:hypothetical protein
MDGPRRELNFDVYTMHLTAFPFARPALGAFALLLLIQPLARAESPQPAVSAETVPSAEPVPTIPPLSLVPHRRQDELWLLDARRLGCGCDCDRLGVARGAGCGAWLPSNMAEFDAADPTKTTIFFVHGNRVSPEDAYREARRVYRALAPHLPPGLPIRLVTWSWPSAKIRGPLRDARIKAARTDRSGYLLACVLERLDPAAPVGVLGYSFGARIATGALHLLGGGQQGGYRLAAPPSPRAPLRVALLAAALNNDWLLPGRYHGQALTQTDHLLLLNNSTDRALRHYHLLFRHARPQALGYTGFAGLSLLGPMRGRIEQYDAACIVGDEHSFANYLQSPRLMALVARTLVPAPEAAPRP